MDKSQHKSYVIIQTTIGKGKKRHIIYHIQITSKFLITSDVCSFLVIQIDQYTMTKVCELKVCSFCGIQIDQYTDAKVCELKDCPIIMIGLVFK